MRVCLLPTVAPGITHENRVALAHQLCELCIKKHGTDIAAIGMYGSTAIEMDGPYSDLDMTIVTYADLGNETKCYTYHGLMVTLDYQTVEDSLSEARDPAEGGCWESFHVLHDPDAIIEKLRTIFRGLNRADYLRRLERKMQDELPTLIGKIRNAVIAGDRAQLLYSTQGFGEQLCRSVCLLNEIYVTGNAFLRSEAKKLKIVPFGFGDLLDTMLGVVPVSEQEMYESAEKLWEEMQRLVYVDLMRPEATTLQA